MASLSEKRLSQLLAIASNPLENILISLMADNRPKQAGALEEAVYGMRKPTSTAQAMGVRKRLSRLVGYGLVTEYRELARTTYKLSSLGSSQGVVFAPWHLSGILQYGVWLGFQHGEPSRLSSPYLRFRIMEHVGQKPSKAVDLVSLMKVPARYQVQVNNQIYELEELGLVTSSIQYTPRKKTSAHGSRFPDRQLSVQSTPRGNWLQEAWVLPYRNMLQGEDVEEILRLERCMEKSEGYRQTMIKQSLRVRGASSNRSSRMDEARAAILGFLQQSGPISSTEVAKALHWRSNTTYRRLQALVSGGLLGYEENSRHYTVG